jgi:DNA-binding response OmpR family regulator/anti-sigma regulatory factor (Ser/Thr protein kinase)
MIQAPLRVLKTKLAAGEDLENVVLAERNVDRLKELVNQMLDISKIESSKYSLNETLGDIELFLRQLIHLYEHTAKEKNVSILFRCSCPLKTVLFDKDAIEKITGNLLSNAIKYTPAGGQVGLDAESEETEQGVRLMINVWDTGPGIPQQDHKKIFSRFYRSSLTASSAKGVGIGLSLAKDLVDLHKGTIQLKSSSDAGSVFSVCLDLRLPEEKLVPVQAAVKEGAELLLVEDNLEILNFNSRLLEQHQFTVLKARNGKEALSLLEKTLPDLIITDVMMPEMDGAEFLRCLKSNVGTDHIPVIVLSAKASAESRMNMMVLGAQAYLPKPFLPEELIALVNNQLEILSLRKDEFKNIAEVRTQRPEEKFVGKEPYTQKLIQIIFQRLDDPDLSVESLAENMATNRSHFQRKVKALTGYSPSELIKNIRLEKAKEFLLLRKGNITEAAYYTGFSSQSYFTKCFVQHFGIPPTQMLQEMKNPS